MGHIVHLSYGGKRSRIFHEQWWKLTWNFTASCSAHHICALDNNNNWLSTNNLLHTVDIPLCNPATASSASPHRTLVLKPLMSNDCESPPHHRSPPHVVLITLPTSQLGFISCHTVFYYRYKQYHVCSWDIVIIAITCVVYINESPPLFHHIV